MSNQKDIIELIKHTTGQANILTLPRVYLALTGDHLSALFLSQCVYWSDKGKDGWFYKSAPEWEEELGLSRSQVDRCRKILTEFIDTELRKANGAPTIHYRVNMDALSNAICKKLTNPSVRNLQIDMQETYKSLTETTSEINTEITNISEINPICKKPTNPSSQPTNTPGVETIIVLEADSTNRIGVEILPIGDIPNTEIAPSPMPRVKPAKKGDLVDGIIRYANPDNSREFRVKQAIYDLCRRSPNWNTTGGKSFLCWGIEQDEFPEHLSAFLDWWKANDWRGKQGQSPTLEQIRELWPQATWPPVPTTTEQKTNNQDGSFYV